MIRRRRLRAGAGLSPPSTAVETLPSATTNSVWSCAAR